MTTPAACPACGGGLPGEVADADVCGCGQEWGTPVGPFGTLATDRPGQDEWQMIQHLLAARSGGTGGRCEAGTVDCLARYRRRGLDGLTRHQISIHHRRARGMGGTRRRDTHTLANLMLVCGHGTSGCHGWIEHHPDVATGLGQLVAAGADPAATPLTLPSGRIVLLDPTTPFYLEHCPPGALIPWAT